MHDALVWALEPHTPGVMVHTCSRIQEVAQEDQKCKEKSSLRRSWKTRNPAVWGPKNSSKVLSGLGNDFSRRTSVHCRWALSAIASIIQNKKPNNHLGGGKDGFQGCVVQQQSISWASIWSPHVCALPRNSQAHLEICREPDESHRLEFQLLFLE